jgi:superoxide dismutase, Cu-Zn family
MRKFKGVLPPLRAVAVTSSLLGLAGCAVYSDAGPSAVGVIAPTSVATAASMSPQGSVRFQQRADGVFVTGRITGLRPNQEHGFHVHEGADCAGDALGTKGHFNPDAAPHGKHGAAVHHAGDLPALKADGNGVAEIKVLVKKLTVTASPASVVGKGLIVHRDPDDYATQPTGNAGPRPGCAVIRLE